MLNRSLFFSLIFILGLIANFQIASAQPEAVPFFRDGEAQVVEAFNNPDEWIRHDLFVETEFDSDGDGALDRMHVSVTRPSQTETEGLKLPIIYVSSPYFAGNGGNNPELFWDVRHELGETPPSHAHPNAITVVNRPIISESYIKTWVPRGYIVVHSCSPGTGLSQGVPTVGGQNESLAPKAVIDWLCGRAKGYAELEGEDEIEAFWSTGKVGMTGTSYSGTIPLAAATTGVEGLEAIIPVAPNTSYYHYYRSNGLVRSPGGYLGEDIDVLYDFINSGNPDNRAYGNREIRDGLMLANIDRESGDLNDFWAGRDYLNQMDNFKTALLMSHGFNDWNVMPEHSYRIYKAAEDKGLPTQIYYHQNGHGGPPPLSMQNRWFTRYLHGVENGVENDPKAWIVRENDKQDSPTSYPNFPNPDARPVKFYLVGGAPEKGDLIIDKPLNQEIESLIDNFSFGGEALAQAEITEHRLIYVTKPLAQDLHISGIPEITIRMASSKAAANLSVWLVSLPWNESRRAPITDNIINRGWADPQNRNSLRKSEPLVPGEFYEVTFTLNPDDQIIPAGAQIGLMIFSSDKDFTLHPDPGTELKIDLASTSITLPIVGGGQAVQKALE